MSMGFLSEEANRRSSCRLPHEIVFFRSFQTETVLITIYHTSAKKWANDLPSFGFLVVVETHIFARDPALSVHAVVCCVLLWRLFFFGELCGISR